MDNSPNKPVVMRGLPHQLTSIVDNSIVIEKYVDEEKNKKIHLKIFEYYLLKIIRVKYYMKYLGSNESF